MVVALVLIFCGPWLVYLFCPVPDQIVEYRNYSACAGFALMLALVIDRGPHILWLPLLLGFAVLTAVRASTYSSVIRFWSEASWHSSGDASRAYQELGAWTKANMTGIADLNAAEHYFREALKLNPMLGPALNNLAWVLIQKKWMECDEQKKPRVLSEEGRMYLERCAAFCPDYAVAWQDFGTILENEGDTERARRCFELALTLDNTMEVSWNRLGLMAFRSGDPQTALYRFEKVSKLNPSHWEYTYNKAVAMKHAGRNEEGQQLLKSLPQPCPVTHNMIPVEFAQ